MDVNQVPTRLFAAALTTSAAPLFTAKRKTRITSIHWAAGATASPTVSLTLTPKGGSAIALSAPLQALTASSSGELLGAGSVPSSIVLEAGDVIGGLASAATDVTLIISGDVFGGVNTSL